MQMHNQIDSPWTDIGPLERFKIATRNSHEQTKNLRSIENVTMIFYPKNLWN